MTEEQLEQFNALLSARRDAIASLEETRRQASAVVTLDQTCTGRLSRMDALQGQAVALASNARAVAELKLIAAAMARIESGEYGECLDCGEDIAKARLLANPTAELCVSCASAREQNPP